ncbi:hypothetical protein [Haladaptatus sp. CMSO5]
MDTLLTDLELKMRCPKLWMIIVLVPTKAHLIISPVYTLYVSPFSGPP